MVATKSLHILVIFPHLFVSMLAFHKIWHLYLLHTNAGVYVISGDVITKWRSYYGATFLYNNKLVFKTSMENAFIVFGRAIYMYHPPDSSDICVCVCILMQKQLMCFPQWDWILVCSCYRIWTYDFQIKNIDHIIYVKQNYTMHIFYTYIFYFSNIS